VAGCPRAGRFLWENVGTHRERLDALRAGTTKAVSLQEPWISVAEKQGCRVLIESHSTRSEAAGDELDGPTLAKMFRAQARAAAAIDKNPEKYAHYLLEETGGLIDLKDLKLSRLLNAPPTPYTRDRFNENYQWTLGWGLVPPAPPTRTRSTTGLGSNSNRGTDQTASMLRRRRNFMRGSHHWTT
jgi:ABC-type nitrate/sulfonate/bicarbonate transport system substrate-binding protein